MQLREGFKQTEVGLIPDDWELSTLGASCTFENGDRGKNYPSEKSFVTTGYPFVNAGNVDEGRISLGELNCIPKESFDKLGGGKFLPGDFLFCLRGSLGKFGFVDTEFGFGAIASSLIIVRPIKNKLIDHYLGAYFRSSYCAKMIEKLSGGAAQPNLGGQDLGRFIIPLPSLSEQFAIASALSDVDALLAAQEKLIIKKRDIKQAVMHRLLTGKQRLPGFIGEWDVKRLGDLASVSKGTQLHSSETDEWGKFAHLNGGIAPSGYTQKSNVEGDTIAISEGGNSCGFVQFMTEPYWCGGHCYSVISNGIDNSFLFHALKGQQSSIMGLRVGSGLPNVQKTALLNFKIQLPASLAEQTSIATILSDMDEELKALEKQRDKTSAIKQGMMQELLTGRIRFV